MSPRLVEKFYETPYIYAKNYFQNYTSAVGPAATNGTLNDVITSDGDSDFFARRVYGVYNFYDNNQALFVSSQGQNVGFVQDFPLAPEKLYPLGASIPIQLLIAGGAYPNPILLTYPGGTTAFVGVTPTLFQGVKRWKGKPNTNPNYKFYEKQYTYCYNAGQGFALNWTYLIAPYTSFIVAPSRSFYMPILDYDFELWAIEVSGDYNNQSIPNFNGYMMKLYDANGYALMKDFIHYRQLSYNSGYNGTKGTPAGPGENLQYQPNCFPVPPVVYPRGSNLQFDILSLLDTNTEAPGTQYINFRGVRRIPC